MSTLYNKYIVTKADGSPVDPEAKYFVLRYDRGSKDDDARSVLLEYARQTSNVKLQRDILRELREMEDQ